MLTVSKSRAYALVCAVVVAPALVVLLPETADRRPECVQAKEWASAHSNRLPTSLPALTAFPGAHRQAIFAALSPEAKAALWQARLERHLADPTLHLTATQRALVEEARGFVTADIYRTRRVPQDWLARASRAFDPPAFKQTFRVLAKGDGAWTLESAGVMAKQRWNDAITAWARPLCDCWDTADCGGFGTCQYLICSWDYGCGPFGTDQCVGVCR